VKLLDIVRNIAGSVSYGAYRGVDDSRYRTQGAYHRSRDVAEERALSAYGRKKMTLELRDLWRNNEIVRGAVNRVVSYSVWNGLFPIPQTNDPEWNKVAAQYWRDVVVPTIDYRQMQGVDLTSLQQLTGSHRFVEGDLGYVLLKNGQVQPIEGARIKTPTEYKEDPRVTAGIRTTPGGLVLGYYVCDRADGGGAVSTEKWRYIRRENFIHCFNPGRIDQGRGVADLATVVNKCRDYDETDNYVLNKIKVDAEQQFKRITQTGRAGERSRGGYTRTETDDMNPQRVIKTEWGTVHNLLPSEDLQAFESKTPNAQYVPYLEHELKAIAMAIGIPYEYLMLIFTSGSFTAQRAAMLHANHTFTEIHTWLEKAFLNRLYNWRVAKAIKDGAIKPAPVDPDTGLSQWHRKEWSLPYFPALDPAKQAKADETRYKNGKGSIESQLRSEGRSRDTVFSEKGADIQAAIDAANAINERAGNEGAGVTWRDIIQAHESKTAAAFAQKGPSQA